MIYDDEEIFSSEARINFLSITIESIYNPPIFFVENAEYKAGTIVYIDDEVIKEFNYVSLAKDIKSAINNGKE